MHPAGDRTTSGSEIECRRSLANGANLLVALRFNLLGHDFEHGLMILSDSLLAATDALKSKSAQIANNYQKYEARLAAGEPPEGEWDEDGVKIWERSEFFRFDLELINEALNTLRKAYVIAVFHHWERVIRRLTGLSGHETFDRLVESAAARGQPIHARLTLVSDLNNTLKHDSMRAGPKLLKSWPGVFPPGYADRLAKREAAAAARAAQGLGDGGMHYDWHDAVQLSQEHMDEVFAIVRESGPRANTFLPGPA